MSLQEVFSSNGHSSRGSYSTGVSAISDGDFCPVRRGQFLNLLLSFIPGCSGNRGPDYLTRVFGLQLAHSFFERTLSTWEVHFGVASNTAFFFTWFSNLAPGNALCVEKVKT